MKRLVRAILIVIALGGLLVACVASFAVRELRSPVSESKIAQQFVVEQDQTLATISNNLQERGLIRRALAFRFLAGRREAGPRIQAGTYFFSPNMTMSQILDELVKPQKGDFDAKRFTVPEGLRLEEVAAIIEGTGVVSATEFLELAADGGAFKDNYPFLADLPPGASLEGFLFPDTYDIFTSATAEEIIGKMLDNFGAKYADVTPGGLASGRSVYEIVTMAAIVQREASNDEEMPLISAVFWNRLEPEFAGNLLGSDPTIQYAAGYSEDEQSWWRKNIDNVLDIDSPYNTRTNAGLPPGPIASPGLVALKAAAAPADEDVTFFVAKCVPAGERPTHNFTNDPAEFSVFEQEYLNCPDR